MEANQFKPLNLEEQKYLLKLARASLVNFLKPGEKFPAPMNSPALQQKLGAFVTLHSGTELRGCTGYITSEKPLPETIKIMAVTAASKDPRFPPVSLPELPQIEIEISVLSPLKKIEKIEEIEIGRHGLLVSRPPVRGLLLPQVATELGWDRQTFVERTCWKAGLPSDAYRDADVELFVFTAQVFDEKLLSSAGK